jgi:hypothetical protein
MGLLSVSFHSITLRLNTKNRAYTVAIDVRFSKIKRETKFVRKLYILNIKYIFMVSTVIYVNYFFLSGKIGPSKLLL